MYVSVCVYKIVQMVLHSNKIVIVTFSYNFLCYCIICTAIFDFT